MACSAQFPFHILQSRGTNRIARLRRDHKDRRSNARITVPSFVPTMLSFACTSAIAGPECRSRRHGAFPWAGNDPPPRSNELDSCAACRLFEVEGVRAPSQLSFVDSSRPAGFDPLLLSSLHLVTYLVSPYLSSYPASSSSYTTEE